jgi:hypothetical protein
MVSPVRGDYRRLQVEIPLIVLFRFPGPALNDLPQGLGKLACIEAEQLDLATHPEIEVARQDEIALELKRMGTRAGLQAGEMAPFQSDCFASSVRPQRACGQPPRLSPDRNLHA